MRALEFTFRFLFFCLLVTASFWFLSVIWAGTVSSDTQNSSYAPTNMANKFSDSVSAAVTQTSSVAAQSGASIVDGVHDGAVTSGQAIGNGVGYVARIPGNIVSAVARFSLISVIQPAATATLPQIDDPTASTQPVIKSASAASPNLPGEVPIWPLHGRTTTPFGVPEPPYQPIHTGMDISDGQRSGVSPIHPFKSGQVAEVIHSRSGLGNHVVIVHGNGLTSVYGHLASISVTQGQKVNQGTVLGFEGSTGVSTGPHLHFEIRVDGRPVNPRAYISGYP